MIVLLLQSTLICGVTWFLWKYFRRSIVKSPLDNLPGPPPQSLWKGNLGQLYDRHGWDFYREIGEKYGPVVKLNGMFGHKILYIHDPKAMHSIIVKDQYTFEIASWAMKGNLAILGPGLLSTLGDHHRKQRKLLNPVFSINHMRHMLPIFYQVTCQLRDAIESRVRNGPAEIDMLGWMGRTALELIGQAGLGYSFDPLVRDVPDAFGDAVKSLVPTLFEIAFFRRALPLVPEIGSPAFRRKVLGMLPIKGIQKLLAIVDTIHMRSTEIFVAKKDALLKGDESILQQIGEGKDLMSILLKANMAASVEDKLEEKELIAQMSTFIFAAMDTTSNALALTLDLLSQHPDVQEKLRKEIVEARDGRDLPYDELVELPYLDAVCRETLRLHPLRPSFSGNHGRMLFYPSLNLSEAWTVQ
ncbi:hypothetical protein A0H81_12340 [Grifola frondosa]|uniref:Cytochrome P450 n=1 Tax=Grifola frondosa TaxID=5627 RepID=A0A1C7LS93_GRIFR|nr:hypothetical protein A0H81_12340 [Grifola frondosa]